MHKTPVFPATVRTRAASGERESYDLCPSQSESKRVCASVRAHVRELRRKRGRERVGVRSREVV
eukprot:6182463-Pleurochrysis_carterae.AAC.2